MKRYPAVYGHQSRGRFRQSAGIARITRGVSRTLVLVACLLGGQVPTAIAERVDFTFAYDEQEGYPSFMGTGSAIPDEYPGTYIEILRLVEERVPIRLHLVRYPWERCKALIGDNEVDAINSSFQESRRELGVFPSLAAGAVDVKRRITQDAYRLYHRMGSGVQYDPAKPAFENAQKPIMAPIGYSIVNDLAAKGLQLEQSSAGLQSMLGMLALDRVSGVIAHEGQAEFILESNPRRFTGIVASEPALAIKPYYILISQRFYQAHTELAEQIWNTIAELRESHLPAILERYQKHFLAGGGELRPSLVSREFLSDNASQHCQPARS